MAFLQDIQTDGQPFHCTQTIDHVQVKGMEGEEKIFVRVKRVIFAGRFPGELKGQPSARLRITEHRTLVFMRDNRQQGSLAVGQSPSKVLKPTQTPDFSHTIVPTRELLFQFSALTLNAHAVHLDRQFCREIEGHRNLLVHGPLTVVLMIEVLRSHLQTLVDQSSSSLETTPEQIVYVEYRNLAPLYADEEMKICVKRREKEVFGGPETWDIWIEGRDGGYAVKGTAKTSSSVDVSGRRFKRSRSQRAFSGHGIAPQESILQGDNIPQEEVAFQNAIHEGNETLSTEEKSLEEEAAIEEKAERETELEAEKEAEEEAEEIAPDFRR